jgi:hypothetical protein
VVVFLIHLNGFLRGRLEGYIDAFLSVCCVTLIVMVFWLQGWRIGLAWVVGSLLLGYVLKPLARVVAGFLLR